jgi:hypothetical protein
MSGIAQLLGKGVREAADEAIQEWNERNAAKAQKKANQLFSGVITTQSFNTTTQKHNSSPLLRISEVCQCQQSTISPSPAAVLPRCFPRQQIAPMASRATGFIRGNAKL